MRPLPFVFLSAITLPFLTACSEDSLFEGASRGYDVQKYAILGGFDWNARKLDASVTIDLTLTEDAPTIVLDSRVTVKSVSAEHRKATFEVDADKGLLAVSLAEIPNATQGTKLSLRIEYEATTNDDFYAITKRLGDPVLPRALYTDSEPLGAASWMPCNNVPTDRALFSVSLGMEAAESLIANGRLVVDATDAGGRRMMYETDWELPPYQMAFAVSSFEVEKAATKTGLPVEVWHRRGLGGSHADMAKALAGMVDRFAVFVGPYPYPRYALVLLPGFPVGGMENASISFQRETSSTEPAIAGDFYLAAHELAHQWFGDLVTVETWDDLWIKEGMANLLEYEAGRDRTDRSQAGTLHGESHGGEEGAAIRDRSLAPKDKYTSGPYSRSAWLLTQIRSLTGEEVFWSTLRGILKEHRFGAIGTEAFVEAFAPALGPEATARVRKAIDAKAMPVLKLQVEGDGSLGLRMEDREGALVAPLLVRWYGADGSAEEVALSGGTEEVIPAAATEVLLVVDPQDVHPEPIVEAAADEVLAMWTRARALGSEAGKGIFVGLDGAAQVNALRMAKATGDFLVTPAEMTGFVGGLHADGAEALALSAACGRAASTEDPAEREAWIGALSPLLQAGPPVFGLGWASGGYGACGDVAPPETLFAAEWPKLEAGLAASDVAMTRLQYLGAWRLTEEQELGTFGVVATTAPSMRARRIALDHLARRAPEVTSAAWATFFVDLLGDTRTAETLPSAIRAAGWSVYNANVGREEMVAALGEILRDEATRPVHARALCTAARALGPDTEPLRLFLDALPAATLSTAARDLRRDPAPCF